MRFYIIFCTNVMSGLPLWCTDLRFGLPPASPPLQSPFHSSFSLLLDFLASSRYLKVHSAALPRSFWTSAHLSLLLDFRASPLHFKVQSTAISRSTTQKRRIATQSANSNPPVAIRQSQSTSSILHQPIPPSKAPAISATSESGTRTYLPSGTNHFPIGLSAPALTASTANFFPATQKNIIAASIAPSGQI